MCPDLGDPATGQVSGFPYPRDPLGCRPDPSYWTQPRTRHGFQPVGATRRDGSSRERRKSSSSDFPCSQLSLHGRQDMLVRSFPMLKKRGKWFSYRKAVPQHLRGFFQGCREIVVSLHMQDEGEARLRVLQIAHGTEKALQWAREKHRALPWCRRY